MKVDFTLDDVAAALKCLDCADTDIWIRAGMAIKKEFGEDGFDTWDNWSSDYSRYNKKNTRDRWKSFHGSSAKGTVTLGSVMHWAFQRGFTLDRPELTDEQRAQFAKEREERQARLAEQWAKEEADILRWYDSVAELCGRLLPHLKTTGNSPYLGKKKIHSGGCYFAPCSFIIHFKPDFTIDLLVGEKTRDFFEKNKKDKELGIENVFLYFKRGSILIPLFDAEKNRIANFQIIYNDGKTKRFLTNGRKSGYWFVIGDLVKAKDGALLFCEGFATGESLHMATGWPVVVCFDAFNMIPVAEAWAHYDARKIFVGDNDWKVALDPKKKNTGLVKSQVAATMGRGTWCIPEFSQASLDMFADDDKAPSDFNDMHLAEGLPAVKTQLVAALAKPIAPKFIKATGDKDALREDSADRRYTAIWDTLSDSPPDYSEIPLPDEYGFPASNDDSQSVSPDPSINVVQLSIDGLLRRYALTDPDAKIWDSDKKKIVKPSAFKTLYPTLQAEWFKHEKRRMVSLDDVYSQVAAAQKKGRGGLGDALRRYVYLNPSDTVWDRQTRELVAVSHLKIAIADCYLDWVTHPEREEIPVRNLVFDPTQQCNPKTHINQFKGLASRPVQNDKLCERIVHMLLALCNGDREVFKWLRRWLAYPLINVGAKMETAVLCHSDVHGSGKSYFFDVVMRAIYGEYSRTVGQAQLEGQYNDWMSKVLYCVYEEVLSRSQRYSHTGTIKQTITGKTVRIEKKFMSGWEEANHMNSVFLSNEVLPLPVEPSDRRFLVIWPETKLYEELQRGVDEDLKQGGAAAFYHFLLSTKMQDADEPYPFNEHTKPPMTEAKQRLIEHGRAIWEVFYYEWERGALEHNGMRVPYGTIRIADLFRYFEAWCSVNKEHGMGSHKFSSFIGSKVKKRRDLDYSYKTFIGKATFYIIGKCPGDKTQSQWLGACVEGHHEILNRIPQNEQRQAA